MGSQAGSGIQLVHPQSRKGSGPGIILITPPGGDSVTIKDGIPSAPFKWAEESYTVVSFTKATFEATESPLKAAIDALSKSSTCAPLDSVGLVVYDPSAWDSVVKAVPSAPQIVAAVCYGDAGTFDASATPPVPTVWHLAGKAKDKLPRTDVLTAHDYPKTASHLFATPFSSAFDYASENVSHTRNLTHLKRHMKGPYFDLEAIWDEHTYWEFENRNVDETMATMVAEPYVNHIPTITGGIGRTRLTDFYTHHFIFNNPADTELELISRTVGIDRVIDEFIFKFNHDSMIDWLIPGIPPTGRRVEVPFTAVVNIRGDKLYHEHIAWDQASVLSQLGLLPEYLPFPYKSAGGSTPAAGNRFEYRLPVAGAITGEKMRDKNSVPSNEMFEYAIREVKDS